MTSTPSLSVVCRTVQSDIFPDILNFLQRFFVPAAPVIYILVYLKYFSSKLKPKPITHGTTTP